ncbi:MAG: DNA alkylation repair protein, partial [Patescibacteria group bacterium]|nr:DNA alkylation repair protein [Patescibacteria group bacterium]
MNKITSSVRKDLKANIDKEYKIGSKRFFKEKITCYGVRTPIVRKIAKKYSKEIQGLSKKELFEIAENLFNSDYNEETTIATGWLIESMSKITDKDFPTLSKWIDKYLNNWSKIDDYCSHLISSMIIEYPHLMKNLKDWSVSKNLWVRRASAVGLITTNSEFYAKENVITYD